jgi:nucleoid-associated protein YgaU
MKRISFLILFTVLAAATVFGQDAATQSQIDKLSGQIQDLLAAQEQQGKKIDALAKEVSELRDKVNTPQVNDSASAADLKNLAEKVQEVDKKRQADRELILKEIDKLGKVAAGAPSHARTAPAPVPAGGGDPGTAAPAAPQKGYYYTVQSGDTLAAIAKAYREQGVKVTTSQILKANPGLDANKLYSGKKIFIPDPNAK